MVKDTLEIIDDFDLDELVTRFGFTICVTPNRIVYIYNMLYHHPEDRCSIVVDADTRLVAIEYELKHGGRSWTCNLTVLHRLFQAGIIKAMEE